MNGSNQKTPLTQKKNGNEKSSEKSGSEKI